MVKETGGINPVTLCNAYLLFSYFEIWLNGLSIKAQTIYAESLLFFLGQFHSNEQQIRIGSSGNFTPSSGYQGETQIAAGSSATYYIKLYGSFFSNTKIYFPALKAPIILRAYLNGNPVKTGTGTIGITSITLQVPHYLLGPSDHQALVEQYKNETIETNFLDTQHVSYPNTLMTSGQQQNYQLNTLIGQCPYLFVMIRSSLSSANDAHRLFLHC